MSCGNVIFCHRDNQISESMKRIIIICEGPTEREFCNTVLAPYLAPKGIYLNAPLIKHSHGGIVPWPLLQQQIDIHLRAEHTAYVTTLIDYYGLADRHHFPMWEASRHLAQVHRLERIIRGYDKVVYGNYIAEAIGINRICERCPRFNSWVESLTAVKDLA